MLANKAAFKFQNKMLLKDYPKKTYHLCTQKVFADCKIEVIKVQKRLITQQNSDTKYLQ